MCVCTRLLCALRFSTSPVWAASSPACTHCAPADTCTEQRPRSWAQSSGQGLWRQESASRIAGSSGHLLPGLGLFGALPPVIRQKCCGLGCFRPPLSHILPGGIVAWHGLHFPRGLTGGETAVLPTHPFPSGCLRFAFSCLIVAGRFLGAVPSTRCWAPCKITSLVASSLPLYPVRPHLPPSTSKLFPAVFCLCSPSLSLLSSGPLWPSQKL